MGGTVALEDFVTRKTDALFLVVIHFGLCIWIFGFRMASSAFFTTGVKRKWGGMGSSGETAKRHRKKCKNSPFLNLVAGIFFMPQWLKVYFKVRLPLSYISAVTHYPTLWYWKRYITPVGYRNRASAVAQLFRYLFFTCHEIKNRLPRAHFLKLISKIPLS